MTALSDALRDFYERKRGRIVFQNGMSLNQLALEMWERLGFCQIDPSVLSRVLKGERLFTPSQLQVFGRILHLSSKAEKKLKKQVLNDYANRFGLRIGDLADGGLHRPESLVEPLSISSNLIAEMRMSGNFDSVQNLTDILIEINNFLLDDGGLPKSKRNEFLKIKGNLLLEKVTSFTDTLESDKTIRNTLPYLREIESIAKEIGNEEMLGYFSLLKGASIRISSEKLLGPRCFRLNSIANGIVKNGLEFIKKPSIKFASIKSLITGFGILGDSQSVHEYEKSALSLIEKDGNQNLILVSNLLASLGSTKSYLQQKDSVSLVEKSWEIYHKKIKKSFPWLELGLIRYTLETAYNLKHHDQRLIDEMEKKIEINSHFGLVRPLATCKERLLLLKNLN